MSSSAPYNGETLAHDSVSANRLSPEVLAARKARRDYIICLCVAMVTPILLFGFAALLR